MIAGTVRTSVGQQKNRRAHDVPLRRDLAAMLAEQIVGKPPAVRVFDFPRVPADMLRYDMLGAGIPLIDEDELPLRFHSFRATCAQEHRCDHRTPEPGDGGPLHPRDARDGAKGSRIASGIRRNRHNERSRLRNGCAKWCGR